VKLPIPHGRRAILVLGVPLGLAAAGAFVFVQMSSASVPVPVRDPGPEEHGPMLALESRVVNLSGSSQAGAFKYAKVAVTVELRPASDSFYALSGTERAKEEKTATDELAQDVPLLLDALGRVVSAHDSASLTTPDGRAALKAELLAEMRKVMGEEKVISVYFTDFVMQ
jgi:flagellar basal body-associated protein FliL